MRALTIVLGLTQLLYCCTTPRQIIYHSPEILETQIQTSDQLIIKTKAGSEINFNLISRDETTLFGWKTETLGGEGIRTQTQIPISQIDSIGTFGESIVYPEFGRTDKKFKRYDIWISLYGEPSKLKGILYEVKGPSIVVHSIYQEEVFYSNIKTIKIRRANNVRKGARIGAATGFVVGFVAGLAEGDTEPCSDPCYYIDIPSAEGKAVVYGLTLAAYGAGIGALLGLPKRRIPINGSFVNFDNNRNKLEGYSIKVLSNSHPEEPIQ